MLPNEKNDLMYLINILEYIGKTWKYTEGINDPDELFELNDQMNLCFIDIDSKYWRKCVKNN